MVATQLIHEYQTTTYRRHTAHIGVTHPLIILIKNIN